MTETIATGTLLEISKKIEQILDNEFDSDGIEFSLTANGEKASALKAELDGVTDYKEKFPEIYQRIVKQIDRNEYPMVVMHRSSRTNIPAGWYVYWNDEDTPELVNSDCPIATDEEVEKMGGEAEIVYLALQAVRETQHYANVDVYGNTGR